MQRGSLLFVAGASVVLANDNGLALTPPLGWRSWNLYGANVNQTLIESIMDGMIVKHNGTSLCDLGYCDVGLDDNWQACGSPKAADGMHYHDADGNPIVNTETFPDLKAMTDHAHSLNLTSGWYGNNCICSDHCSTTEECDQQIKADVEAMTLFNFDSWKLDGCGGEKDLVDFNKYIEAAGKPILVENCHWGRVVCAHVNVVWAARTLYIRRNLTLRLLVCRYRLFLTRQSPRLKDALGISIARLVMCARRMLRFWAIWPQ